MQRSINKEYWITNISKRRISLPDLGIEINPLCSINLLDKKHYSITFEQIIKSVKEGSIYERRNRVIPRISPPIINKFSSKIPQDLNASIPHKSKSAVQQIYNEYEELKIDEEEFAKNSVEENLADTTPFININKGSK